MNLKEIRELREGSRVTWHDPDDGLTTYTGTLSKPVEVIDKEDETCILHFVGGQEIHSLFSEIEVIDK